MRGRLEVLDVSISGEAPGIAHASIDKPLPGATSGEWVLDVRGSAVGAAAPVSRIDFASGSRVIHSAPTGVARPALAEEHPNLAGAERSGFYATLGALDLAQE